jgi:hypothetical protein
LEFHAVIDEERSQQRTSGTGKLRRTIAAMLEDGLETTVEPFPKIDKEFNDILMQLRELNPADTKSKLVICGLRNHPYGPDKQRCTECIYFVAHRKWCDLPELAIPVEPNWRCRMWRT